MFLCLCSISFRMNKNNPSHTSPHEDPNADGLGESRPRDLSAETSSLILEVRAAGALKQLLADMKPGHHQEVVFATKLKQSTHDMKQLVEKIGAQVKQGPLTSQSFLPAATDCAGWMTPVDCYIQRRGRMTSSCDELSTVMDRHKSTSPRSRHSESVETRQRNKEYEHEIKYYKEIHRIGVHSRDAITQVISYIELYIARLEEIFAERNSARHNAACKWLAKLGIEISINDFEQSAF